MTKEKLEEYLSNLNLNYYTEEELEKIYNSVKSKTVLNQFLILFRIIA